MLSTRKMKIGLDFDDVLINFNNGLALFHNRYYGTSYAREHITKFQFTDLWKCSADEALRRMREFVRSPHHREVTPIEGAVDAIATLEKFCDLFIITARDEVIQHQTTSLLGTHFTVESFKEIHFLHRNDVNVLGTKGDTCLRLGVELLVEDALHNALDVANVGTRVLLLDTPWNQDDNLHPLIKRVFSWEEVVKEILLLQQISSVS